ncbi:AAEL006740-PA [Aedes aegypti]|uniref:AAEL006740-PA n=1 Tax=Aedes aegypti TaxID=7159 RepID=Q174X7_AEDAE|nr:AAEL006740-PA [Aedes aegypti]
MNTHLVVIFLVAFGKATVEGQKSCDIPKVLQGTWFSWEVGEPTTTTIDEWSYERQGPKQGRQRTECVASSRNGSDHTLIFKGSECYTCVKAFPRTLNVFEKFETPCVTLERNEKPTIDRICRGLRQDQQLITLFNKNFVPISCRSSLEGVWHFAYQVSQWVECRDAANTFKTMGRTKDNKAETDGRNIKSLSKV